MLEEVRGSGQTVESVPGEMALVTRAIFGSPPVQGSALVGYAMNKHAQYVTVLLEAIETGANDPVVAREWRTLEDEHTKRSLSFDAMKHITSRLPDLCKEVAAEVRERREKQAPPGSAE